MQDGAKGMAKKDLLPFKTNKGIVVKKKYPDDLSLKRDNKKGQQMPVEKETISNDGTAIPMLPWRISF